MTIGERIRAEREAQKVSRRDLAEFAGIAITTLSDLELGLSNSTTALHKVAERLKLRTRWLETGRGPKEQVSPSDDPDWPSVRGYAQAVGLGAGGIEAQEYAETYSLKFRASSLSRKHLVPQNLAVMYGAGDSMQPRVQPGDAILFDTQDTTPRDGRLYVIQCSGNAGKEYQVKRAMILDDVIYFAADNPAGDHQWVKPRRMDAKRSSIEVIGRVRWIGSWED